MHFFIKTLTGAFALLPALHAGACEKTVRWYDDPPYSFRAPDGNISGFDVEMVREAFRRMGCHAKFVNMPWARAMVELEAGRLDVLPSIFRSSERDKFAYFSIASMQSPNVLYIAPAAQAAYHLTKLSDILGTRFRLGVQIGVSYGTEFELLKSDPRFRENYVPVTLRLAAWKMMERGRIDGIIADEASARFELEQLGLERALQQNMLVVSTSTAMVAFSKRTTSPQFVNLFNKSLAAMIADGQYRFIRNRHLRCPTSVKVLGCS